MAGVMFAFVLNALFMSILKVPLLEGRSMACSIVNMPFSINSYSSPSWNSVFYRIHAGIYVSADEVQRKYELWCNHCFTYAVWH